MNGDIFIEIKRTSSWISLSEDTKDIFLKHFSKIEEVAKRYREGEKGVRYAFFRIAYADIFLNMEEISFLDNYYPTRVQREFVSVIESMSRKDSRDKVFPTIRGKIYNLNSKRKEKTNVKYVDEKENYITEYVADILYSDLENIRVKSNDSSHSGSERIFANATDFFSVLLSFLRTCKFFFSYSDESSDHDRLNINNIDELSDYIYTPKLLKELQRHVSKLCPQCSGSLKIVPKGEKTNVNCENCHYGFTYLTSNGQVIESYDDSFNKIQNNIPIDYVNDRNIYDLKDYLFLKIESTDYASKKDSKIIRITAKKHTGVVFDVKINQDIDDMKWEVVVNNGMSDYLSKKSNFLSEDEAMKRFFEFASYQNIVGYGVLIHEWKLIERYISKYNKRNKKDKNKQIKNEILKDDFYDIMYSLPRKYNYLKSYNMNSVYSEVVPRDKWVEEYSPDSLTKIKMIESLYLELKNK